jgi:hypothetical protein
MAKLTPRTVFKKQSFLKTVLFATNILVNISAATGSICVQMGKHLRANARGCKIRHEII